jgi:hypothetical protein
MFDGRASDASRFACGSILRRPNDSSYSSDPSASTITYAPTKLVIYTTDLHHGAMEKLSSAHASARGARSP